MMMLGALVVMHGGQDHAETVLAAGTMPFVALGVVVLVVALMLLVRRRGAGRGTP